MWQISPAWVIKKTKPPGMQASITRCLSQVRINWKGYGRKGIWRKMGDDEGGGTDSSNGGGIQPECHCTCLYYLSWTIKFRSDEKDV